MGQRGGHAYVITRAEEYLGIALDATRDGNLADVLDRLPVAIYLTDVHGTITHFNRACIDLAGRTPVVSHDKWCVTWKLYTLAGASLPHDRCPMAVAIKERRPVRGAEAIAERPDGTRIQFVPYPTPLFDEDGTFAGAVNLLVDVTQLRHAEYLREQAARCRRLALSISDSRTIRTLKGMAEEYEGQAAQLLTAN
jgi:PAS domain-containing protein